jgi:hypothetical protein
MAAIIAVALSRAFYTVVRYEINAPAQRDAADAKTRFEDRLTAILQAAYLSSTSTDLATYLIGTSGGQNPNGSPNLTAAQAAPGSAAATAAIAGQSNGNTSSATPTTGGNSDGIVLTCLGQQIPPTYLQITGVQLTDDSTQDTPTGGSQNFQQQQGLPNGQAIEQDLQTLNNDYGPHGGVVEISISNTPVGDPGQFSSDVYMRVQDPADADYTQGGKEQVFDTNVQKMQFEFFDGLQWDGGWDTTSTGGRHLPAAIRVHYWLKSDPDTENIFVVRIPLSDLTPSNPITNTTTTSTVTGATTGGGGGGAGGFTGGGTGGTTGGTTGRTGGTTGTTGRGIAPAALGGEVPFYSNIQIVPEGQPTTPSPAEVGGASPPSSQIPATALNGLSDPAPKALGDSAPKQPTPDWKKPAGPFSFTPHQDPILAPAPPLAPVTKPKAVSKPAPKPIVKVGPQ